MKDKIINEIKKYHNIAILGFAREGLSTYNFIRSFDKNIKLTILDEREIIAPDQNTVYKKYNGTNADLMGFDLIIKTPGVPILGLSKDICSNMTSQMELLLKFNSENVIGVTGTKGKSTTVSLLYEVFKDQLEKVCLVGNIGVPVLDKIDELDGSIIIAEMSSHQLETLDYSPHIGVILNLYSDHLDHAGTIENYHNSKMNIVRYQKSDDYAIYDLDNTYLKKQNFDIVNSNKLTVSIGNNANIYMLDDKIYLNGEFLLNKSDIKTDLKGEHNLKNILFVLLISSLYKLDIKGVLKSIEEFKPLKHRMEYVGKYDDIEFYDDAIATIPDATINAIAALKNVDTLIFGGMDRHIDYSEFINYLNTGVVRNLICMPTTGYIIADSIQNNINVYRIESLEEAVKLSKEITEKGKICLLSPAAASYEFYKNFEEKGNAFQDFVKNKNNEG